MRNPTMVYKAPGPHPIHGGFFDYKIIDADEEDEVKAAQAEGWFFTTPEAAEAYEVEKAEREAELAAQQFASDGTQAAAPSPKAGKKAATPPAAPAPANVGTQAPVAPGNGDMSAAGGWTATPPAAQ